MSDEFFFTLSVNLNYKNVHTLLTNSRYISIKIAWKQKLINLSFFTDMSCMNRKIFITILELLLFLSCLGAETVMIYSSDSWYTPERRQGEEYILYALEDGMMEVLFDAGHIIYNDYAPPLTETDYGNRNRISYRIARSGGAEWLVEMTVLYQESGEEIHSLPLKVLFRLTNILSDQVLDTGEFWASDFDSDLGGSDRDICRMMGEAIGNVINSFL